MATQTEVDNLDAAIQRLSAGTQGESLTIGERSFTYPKANLPDARDYLEYLKTQVALAAGTFSPRTLAKQGGRGI